MKRVIIFLVALVAFAALLGGVTASADSFVMPEPFVRESEDGSRVFVFNPLSDENFPAMGVYENTDPLALIYEINLRFMVFDRDFHFTDDMRSFVFVPQVSQDIAVEFYRDGILMHSYRIPNLVRDGRQVQYSVSMAFWYDYESRIFDRAGNIFTITTVDNLTYVFDVITGEVIEGEIIVTDEVWSPFHFMEEESPVIYPYILSAEDLDFDISAYITIQNPIDLPLDDFALVEPAEPFIVVQEPDNRLFDVHPENIGETDNQYETPPDIPLVIGIVVISVGAAGIATTIVLLKCKKNA